MHSVDARENCKSINFAQENRRDSPILPPLFLPLPPGFGRGGPYIFQELQQRRSPLIPPSPFSELAGYNTTAQRFPDRGGKKSAKRRGRGKLFFCTRDLPTLFLSFKNVRGRMKKARACTPDKGSPTQSISKRGEKPILKCSSMGGCNGQSFSLKYCTVSESKFQFI